MTQFEPIVHEHYTISVEEQEGYPFLNMSIDKMDKEVFLSIRSSIDQIKNWAYDNNYELMYAHTTNQKIVRLWDRLYPLYDVEKMSDSDWVGAWETGVN